MFFHLLDFSGLILWSVAPAPGAQPFQITVRLVKTLAPGNRRHFGLSRGSQVGSPVLGGPTQVLAAPQSVPANTSLQCIDKHTICLCSIFSVPPHSGPKEFAHSH